MAVPTFDHTLPDYSSGTKTRSQQYTAARENHVWTMIAAAANGYRLPGWTTTANGANLAEPDNIIMTKGSIRMQWVFTWSSGSVTQEVWKWDDGGGTLQTLTTGTITISYDGSGNFSGATSA